MTGDFDPAELPPGLQEEYLVGARATLGLLAGLADRIAAVPGDPQSLDQFCREAHKVHGSAGSYGFWDASRLAAGMEETAKDWLARPDDPDVDRGSLARWFVLRLAEMLKLEVPVPKRRPPEVPRPAPAATPVSQRTEVALKAPATPPKRPAEVPRQSPTAAPAPRPTEAPRQPPPTAMPPARPTGTPVAAAPLNVPEVILVEDDASLAELLTYGLSSRGYRFVNYRNGREALEYLLALDVGTAQPLLLLDVDLPGLDGYSIFDALQRERPRKFRVVFTTVHGSEAEQLRGLEAGALDYLVKPMSLRVALEKIRRWVGR